MEPAPMLEDDLVDEVPPVAVTEPTHDDQEPPYLRLRTLVMEEPDAAGGSVTAIIPKDKNTVETPIPDLTDLAVADPPDEAAAGGPATPMVDETVGPDAPAPARFTLSRSRLFGIGAAAFAAGLLTAVGAHLFARPAAIASTIASSTSSSTASPTSAADSPVAPPRVVVAALPTAAPAPAPEAIAPSVAAEPKGPDPSTAHPRPRAQARSQIRARTGRPTGGASSATKSAPDSDGAAPRGQAGWVDPFAE